MTDDLRARLHAALTAPHALDALERLFVEVTADGTPDPPICPCSNPAFTHTVAEHFIKAPDTAGRELPRVGTPDPTPRDTLAQVVWDEGRHGWSEAQEAAHRILSSPEARAAVIAATPRDELLAALVALLPHGFCQDGNPHPAHPVDEGSAYWCVGRNADGHVGADLP